MKNKIRHIDLKIIPFDAEMKTAPTSCNPNFFHARMDENKSTFFSKNSIFCLKMSFLIFYVENFSSEKRARKKIKIHSFVELELLYQTMQKKRVEKNWLDFWIGWTLTTARKFHPWNRFIWLAWMNFMIHKFLETFAFG